MAVPARSFVLSVEASRILASGPCWNAPALPFDSEAEGQSRFAILPLFPRLALPSPHIDVSLGAY
jgi:hypothetical protein